MKIVAIVLVVSILMFACRPAKKVQRVQETISYVDSTPVVIIANHSLPPSTDSENIGSKATGKEIFKKVIRNTIAYSTFNAKVRVEFIGNDGNDEGTAYLRLKKDSLLWLSLRGPLGIEGFRVLINKDSVKVLNILHKSYQVRSIGYLQEITGIPFDFASIQDLVVGNPVFIDSNVVSYQSNSDNQLLVLMVGNIFKHLVSLDNADFKILHSKLNDINSTTNRTVDLTFSNYESVGDVFFSTKRIISVAERSMLNVNLDFKQYTFNQPTTFPFSVPKNFKKII